MTSNRQTPAEIEVQRCAIKLSRAKGAGLPLQAHWNNLHRAVNALGRERAKEHGESRAASPRRDASLLNLAGGPHAAGHFSGEA